MTTNNATSGTSSPSAAQRHRSSGSGGGDDSSLLTTNQPSVSVLNEIASTTGVVGGGDLGSLNNQMLMTTSLGSGSAQLFLTNTGNGANGAATGGNGMLLSANNSIMSKYGSISSLNKPTSSASATNTTAPTTSQQHQQYDNLVYQDDDELLDIEMSPKRSSSSSLLGKTATTTTSRSSPTKSSHKEEAVDRSESKLSPQSDEYYHSPLSTSEIKATSAASFATVPSTLEDNDIVVDDQNNDNTMVDIVQPGKSKRAAANSSTKASKKQAKVRLHYNYS